MEKEYRLLNYLMQQKNTTQRQISVDTGISVGGVNMLLKKMIKKGLIKVENINAKSLRYILTPKGMKEKLERTYRFTRASYQKITKISLAFKVTVEKVKQDGACEDIILYGPKDEILQILKTCLAEINFPYSIIESKNSLIPEPKSFVIVWRVEEEEKLNEYRGRVENVLKKVEF